MYTFSIFYIFLIHSYLSSDSILYGDSINDFHKLENLATVAPSITRWSADHDIVNIDRGWISAVPLINPSKIKLIETISMVKYSNYLYATLAEARVPSRFTYFGSTFILPIAPIATCGITRTGTA